MPQRNHVELERTFGQFYAAYPRKKNRANALKAWKSLKPDAALVAVILAAVERQKTWPEWTKDGGAFIPHPSTWLNGRRWEDQADGTQCVGRDSGRVSASPGKYAGIGKTAGVPQAPSQHPGQAQLPPDDAEKPGGDRTLFD